MYIDFVSLFPEMIRPGLEHSILGRAREKGLVQFGMANPRDYTYDRHGKVDDTPFGGEPGMLIKAEPVALALESLTHFTDQSAVVIPEPAAPTFSQEAAQQLSRYEHVVFVCGHYEGIDHRVRQSLATHVFSLGDYVLTNGELPALVMCDAIVRLLPGALGSSESLKADSFSDGLLSAPNFTRPESWRGEQVPDVLLSGNHQEIRKWRRKQSLQITKQIRPDLLAQAHLTKEDLRLLD